MEGRVQGGLLTRSSRSRHGRAGTRRPAQHADHGVEEAGTRERGAAGPLSPQTPAGQTRPPRRGGGRRAISADASRADMPPQTGWRTARCLLGCRCSWRWSPRSARRRTAGGSRAAQDAVPSEGGSGCFCDVGGFPTRDLRWLSSCRAAAKNLAATRQGARACGM